jgi:hypothetical protein
MTHDEFRRIELAHQISTAVFLGGFVALVLMPFMYGGTWLLQLFGG